MNDSKARVIQYKGLITVEGSLMFKFGGNERLYSELKSSGELYLDRENDMTTLYLKTDSGTVEVEENDYIVEIVDKFDRRYLLTSKVEVIHD